MIVLVDTNILLDVIMQREPFRIAAERIWKLVEERRLQGHISAISLNVGIVPRARSSSRRA